VSFEREKTILQEIFTDRLPLLKHIVARLIGFDGGRSPLHRRGYDGEVREGRACGAFEDRAIWELMYVGKRAI